jgi:SAM-dependent methyltransferase
MSRVEFDKYASAYETLLRDPIRDCFSSHSSGFFHERKRDLILTYFRNQGVDTHTMSYLDLGCGKGDLASLLREEFSRVAGCDPSAGMLKTIQKLETRVQTDLCEIPFRTAEFDFVTAVCVYHHVPSAARLSLTREVSRVLRPGGVFAIIEHNPYNPAARLIVRRAPVDEDALLLTRCETSRLMRAAGFCSQTSRYFLFFPKSLYCSAGDRVERWLSKIPLGGQYVVFAKKSVTSAQ